MLDLGSQDIQLHRFTLRAIYTLNFRRFEPTSSLLQPLNVGKVLRLIVETSVTLVGGEVVINILREVLHLNETTRCTPRIPKLLRIQPLLRILLHPRSHYYVFARDDIRSIVQHLRSYAIKTADIADSTSAKSSSHSSTRRFLGSTT